MCTLCAFSILSDNARSVLWGFKISHNYFYDSVGFLLRINQAFMVFFHLLCMSLQCWEYGISLCRELAFQYETLYDYQSLSWIRVSKVLKSCILKLFFFCYYQTSILCDAGGWDFQLPLSLSSSYAAQSTHGVKHNVLITCAHPHSSIQKCVWLNHCSSWRSRMFVILWQKMEAAYYDNIIEQQRIEPEFFRMGFYGRKFPFFLRVRLTESPLILSVLTQLLLCWWRQLHCSFMLQQEAISAAAVCAGQQAFARMRIDKCITLNPAIEWC